MPPLPQSLYAWLNLLEPALASISMKWPAVEFSMSVNLPDHEIIIKVQYSGNYHQRPCITRKELEMCTTSYIAATFCANVNAAAHYICHGDQSYNLAQDYEEAIKAQEIMDQL